LQVFGDRGFDREGNIAPWKKVRTAEDEDEMQTK
jgi:hypothetical protein